MIWTAHCTVATVVEHQGRFLMVEEHDQGKSVFNQPAGHLEDNESLFTAATRETLEETAWHVELTAFLGFYQYLAPANGVTYLRLCFIAKALTEDTSRTLDHDIIATHWLTKETILDSTFKARSPLVIKAISDYLSGISYPLEIIYQHQDQAIEEIPV